MFKILESSVVDKMYEYGNIRFSLPGKWVEMENKNGKGQGDKFEGTIAIDSPNTNRVDIFKKRYGNALIVNEENGSHYFQLKTTLNKPTFCFYSLTDAHMDEIPQVEKEGIYNVSATLDGRYIKDFSHGLSIEEYEKLNDDDKPAMLVILGDNNIYEFLRRVKLAMKAKYGIEDSNFLYNQVTYDYCADLKSDYLSKYSNPPLELLSKRRDLSYQREARIIINSKKIKLNDYEKDYLEVDIGNMSDIAIKVDKYYPFDQKLTLSVKMTTAKNIIKRGETIEEGYIKV